MAMTSHLRRTNDDPLTYPIDSLRQALAADYSDREEQWAEAVDLALARVEQGLYKNMAKGVAPDGWLATIDQNRASRQVEKLWQSESDLLGQITRLREETQRAMRCSYFTLPRQARVAVPAQAGALTHFESIRNSAAEVLATVAKNSEAETKLIQESVNTDIGGGD